MYVSVKAQLHLMRELIGMLRNKEETLNEKMEKLAEEINGQGNKTEAD